MAAVGNWKQWWVGGTVRVPAAPKISQRSCIVWSGPLLLATWFKTGSPQIVHCVCALPSFDWISPYCFVCLSSPASQGTFTSTVLLVCVLDFVNCYLSFLNCTFINIEGPV